MLNMKIMANPLNWLIVMLMFYIAFSGVILANQYFKTKKETI